MRIRALDPAVANQIAAGEVIEGPTSVLKELLENSLDAGSTQIDILLEGGGLRLIRVQDNGVGIHPDDLSLAVLAHATSKIESLSDLVHIRSYGFRGEALSSIGAVSHLKLSSYVATADQAWTLAVSGRLAKPSLMPAPKHPGTLIEVRDLFYNTPARRAFLRSEKSESLALEQVFKRVALSQVGVGFSLQMSAQAMPKRLSPCTDTAAHARRIAQVCGARFLETAALLDIEINGLKLMGYLSMPLGFRSQADLQYFYVNHRIVRDKIIQHAIRQAILDVAPPGRHAAYVLYFSLDPEAVDVNVHPTKHEVRFREARTVHDFLVHALSTALKRGNTSEKPESRLPSGNLFKSEPQPSLAEVSENQGVQPGLYSEARNGGVENAATSKALGVPIAVLDNTLLLARRGSELVIFDLCYSRRLWLVDQLLEQYHNQGVPQRCLLWPQRLHVAQAQVLNLDEKTDIDWHRLGFDWSPIASNQILLRSVPDGLRLEPEPLEQLLARLFAAECLTAGIQTLAGTMAQMSLGSEMDCYEWFHTFQNWPGFNALEPLVQAKVYRVLSMGTLKNLLASDKNARYGLHTECCDAFC